MTHSPDRRQIWGAITATLLGILVTLVIVAVIQTWAVADDIRNAQKSNQSVIEYIQDCTTPGGECYARSEERTAQAVSGINAGTLRIAVAVESCQADGITDQEALARCTIRRTKAAEEKP